MNALRQTLKQWRWYQWTLAALALLYVIYVALSYLYLPGKLKQVVQGDVAQLLGREIQVRRIAFNPFTLALTVDDFSLADRPGIPLVAFHQLYVDFNAWSSLFGWKIRFGAVKLDAPDIAIEKRKQDFNFSSILARFAKTESPQPAPKTQSSLALQIDDIRILNGRFRYDDVSGARPAHSAIDDITVGVQDLYLATGDSKLNPFHLQAQLPHGGQLQLEGQYRADPLKVDASVVANDVHLEALKDFVANVVPVQLNNGRLSLKTDVSLAQDKQFDVKVSNGQVTVNDLAVDDAAATPPLLRGKQLQVDGIALDLVQQRLHVDAVTLDGFSTDQWLDAEGQPRIQPLLGTPDKATTPAPASAPPVQGQAAAQPAPAAKAPPWNVSVAKVELKNSRVGFTDRRDGLNATQQIHDIDLTLSDIQLKDGARVPLQLTAGLNDAGTLRVTGDIVPMPFSLNLQYQLKGLGLLPFNPYVQQLSWLKLEQGSLDVDGGVQMHTADPLPLTLDLNADLSNFKALDTRSGEAVLQWQALQLQKLQLALAKHQVEIDKVALKTPDVAVDMSADKQLNLASLMKPAPAGQDAKAETTEARADHAQQTAAPAWQVVVHQVSLQQGTTRFRDASVKPVFKTGLYNIDFQLDQLTSNGPQPAHFSLTSKIDKYAPFNVKGTLAPLQQQPGFAFTSELHGLEMPSLSPYTGTYIGYDLQSGKLGLNLNYSLKDRKLSGNNNIVARQLYLGDKVESKQAVSAPVGLGLALLRDASGVIDLDVGVSGALDDPGFSISGIVMKALLNVIVKAATSPFQLLGSLVGGSEDMGSVTFGKGSSVLDDANQTKLRQLVKALAQRPQLALTIHGSASAEDDKTSLQLQRVRQQIAAARKIPLEQVPADLLQDKADRKALQKLNDSLKLPSLDQREAALKKADPKLTADVLTRQGWQQMLADVAAHQTITRQDLINLADQRALAIKQFLVGPAALDQSRVQLQKTGADDLKGRVCKLGVEAG